MSKEALKIAIARTSKQLVALARALGGSARRPIPEDDRGEDSIVAAEFVARTTALGAIASLRKDFETVFGEGATEALPGTFTALARAEIEFSNLPLEGEESVARANSQAGDKPLALQLCEKSGYTDPQIVDGMLWAFPPGGVMPVPLKSILYE